MLALGISDTITSFGIYIVSLIYGLVADLFQVFVVLAKANTIDSNLYNNLVNNFYLLLAVIMLFIVAFSLLKTMVSPDDSKGADTSGKVVKNFVTSVIILAFLPTIFSFAFSFQNAIINYNTIGKIFGGGGIYDSDAQNATEAAGFQMSNGVFLAFFTPTKCEGEISKCREEITANAGMFSKVKDLLDGDKDSQYTFEGAVNYVNAKGKFSIYTDFSEAVNEGDISFNFIVSLIAGCYLLYVVLSFCLDLGFRLVRLIFYQIIAPIPIFLRIVPDAKNDTFGKWVSITFACYIEVFLRLFIIYFGIYLVSILPKAILGTGVDGLTGGKWLLANAIIILGVITFIKESPKLIGGIFGDSANMSLGLKDKLKTGGLFGFGAAGAAVGSFIASKGSISAMKRGWKNGFKNIGAEAERNKLKSDAIASGVSRTDIMKDSFRKKWDSILKLKLKSQRLKKVRTLLKMNHLLV